MNYIDYELNYFLYNSEDVRLKSLLIEIQTEREFLETNNLQKISNKILYKK